jgi:hypothetical protein
MGVLTPAPVKPKLELVIPEPKERKPRRNGGIDWEVRLPELKKCIDDEMTMPEIAAYFNTKAINVSQAMYRHNLYVKRRADAVPEWKLRDMIAMRKAGFTLNKIGDKYEHAAPTVARYLQDAPESLWQSVEACDKKECLTKDTECGTVRGSGSADATEQGE